MIASEITGATPVESVCMWVGLVSDRMCASLTVPDERFNEWLMVFLLPHPHLTLPNPTPVRSMIQYLLDMPLQRLGVYPSRGLI